MTAARRHPTPAEVARVDLEKLARATGDELATELRDVPGWMPWAAAAVILGGYALARAIMG